MTGTFEEFKLCVNESDEDLLRNYHITGNVEYFERLTERNTPFLRAFLRSHYGDLVEMLDDVVQDTWMRVYQKLHCYDLNRPFRPWLRQVAASQAINTLRANERWRRSQERYVEAKYLCASEDYNPVCNDAAGELEARETCQLLRDAIANLPERLRQVVVETVFHGKTGRDAAISLHLTDATASRRLKKARQLLHASLKNAML
ncbi:MAG: sigma-70 family RNA polymerase sigma factor [Planctomycetia bacterium]|nr:sigma-70 family RNA polymerase sigma factor [Planctomycetia bacterium]